MNTDYIKDFEKVYKRLCDCAETAAGTDLANIVSAMIAVYRIIDRGPRYVDLSSGNSHTAS